MTKIDLSIIPEEWFLYKLSHDHSDIVFAGDIHVPIRWVAEIQHIRGGRLKTGSGKSPQTALKRACNGVK